MKNKIYYRGSILLMSALLMSALGGCGDQDEISVSGEVSHVSTETATETVTVEKETVLSENQQAIKEYETKYNTGEFTLEDYQGLAQLYAEEGMIRKQRDMLEQSYRLYDDEKSFADLQQIWVNLAEEDPAIVSEAELMLQNLELPEYMDEAVNLVTGEQWIKNMMPKLYEGQRNYFLLRDGKIALTIQAGYDERGSLSAKVWYYGGEDTATFLQRECNSMKLLKTQMADTEFSGAFEAWLLDGERGDVFKETGTFNDDLYVGEYTAKQHIGTEGSELYSLWSNREGLEYKVYTGQFDEQGKTTLEQLADNHKLSADGKADNYVIYAYDENKQSCLFVNLPAEVDASTHVFAANHMDWEKSPDFTVYEPLETEALTGTESTEGETDGQQDALAQVPKVRIYDGEIQCFVGDTWVSVGAVSEYQKQDPFLVYAENMGAPVEEEETPKGDAENGESTEGTENAESTEEPEEAQEPEVDKRGRGEIIKPTPKPTPKPTSKPKPAATPAPQPAATPAPTPAPQPQQPAPQPQQPAATPAPQPQQPAATPAPQPQEPAPTQAPAEPPQQSTTTPAPSVGGETDIEWSDDIL